MVRTIPNSVIYPSPIRRRGRSRLLFRLSGYVLSEAATAV